MILNNAQIYSFKYFQKLYNLLYKILIRKAFKFAYLKDN